MLWSPLKNKLPVILFSVFLAILSGCTPQKATAPAENKTNDSSMLNEISYLEVASEYFIEGKSALQKGDSALALRYFETAFMLDTNSEILYNKVIEVAITSKNPASAIKIIQRGREYSQMSDDDLRKIGSVYMNFHSYGLAFKVVEAVKEKTRRDTVFLARLSMAESLTFAGALYNSQQKYDSALIVLNRVVVDMGLRAPNILFELAMANERAGNFETAEKYFKEILLDRPKNMMFALSANYLGYMWAEKDMNLAEAEALILMALAEEPENGAYLDSYGWVLYKLGRQEEALKQLLLAEEKIKDDYTVYYHLGEVYLELGDKENALKNLNKANEFTENPDFEKIAEIISTITD
jgi:tetratricopeptide (TPR) repeat protein